MTANTETPDSKEVWHTTVWLNGTACFSSEAWPVKMQWDDDDDGEVEIEIHEAVPGPVILGRDTLKQRLELTVKASDNTAPDLAFKAASMVADTLSFGTVRRVDLSFGTLTTAPPGVNNGDFKTILSFTPVPPSDTLREIGSNYIAAMGQELGDLTSDRSRRIIRSLSWLRRSFSTADPVLVFSSLVFALESLVSLLPMPPGNSEVDQQKPRKKKAPKPGASEIIRHFAMTHTQTSENSWTFVGGLRHSLFHGGVHEDLLGQDELVQAEPILRRVVIAALKHALAIPSANPPDIPAQFPALGIPRLVISGVVRTAEPGI